MVFSLSRFIETSETRSQRHQEFERMMRLSQRQAFAMAIRLTGNQSEAEDLVQDAYLRAYRFFNRYDRAMPFTSWLYRIMANAHIDAVRRNGKLRTSSLDQGTQEGRGVREIADTLDTPDEALFRTQMSSNVQRALESINPDFKMALILADVDGLAYEEIAEMMHTSVGTVRSRIHRGRKQMRAYLLCHAPNQYRSYIDELL